MKRLLPFFAFFFLLGALTAQVVISPSPSNMDFEEGEFDIHADAVLENNGSEDLTLRWNIVNLVSAKEWVPYVCLGIACYPPNQLTGLQSVAAGEEIDVQAHFLTQGVCEDGSYEMTFTDTLTNEVVATGIFTFDCQAVSVFNPANPGQQSIFPNPAVTWFSLGDLNGASRVEMYNIIGKQVAQFAYQPQSRYDISNLAGGIYLVRVIDQQGQLLTTKRLTKNTP